MNKYNIVQKISLIVGITTFIAWLILALDDNFLLHGLNDIEDGFDDVYDVLLFSLTCGYIAAFYLFQDDKKQEYDQSKENE